MPKNDLSRSRRGSHAPTVTIDLVGLPRFKMETHGRVDRYVSTAIEKWGHWESSGTAIVLQLLRGDADFVDIGANIGWYSLVAAHALGARGHVHSFEPEPRNLAKLKSNILINNLENITVNEWALSSKSGTATLHVSDINLGDHSLFALNSRPGIKNVLRDRLDRYKGIDHVRPLVIKLDVQGGEFDVLEGARGVMEIQTRDLVLLCEVAPAALAAAGRSTSELASLLSGFGFAAALVDPRSPRIIPMSWPRLVQFVEQGPDTECDVVAYRRMGGLMKPFFSRVAHLNADIG